jgi:hypothetical protein
LETLLFLIIIGIISTIFGKGKGKNSKPFQMGKPFTANTFDDFKRIFQTEIPKEIQSEMKEVLNKENIQEKYQKAKQELAESPSLWSSPKQAEVAQGRIRATSSKQAEEDQPIILEKPNPDTLINGVIWAEILGEPRSKKPYYVNKK